jgi:hypothetical protein
LVVTPVAAEAEPLAVADDSLPRSETIQRLELSRAGTELVQLEAAGEGWRLFPSGLPADSTKVNRLLQDLLRAPRRTVDPATDPEPDWLTLNLPDAGGAYQIGPGQDNFQNTLLTTPDQRQWLVAADLRGDLGLFGETGGEPDPGFWLEQAVLSFDPGEVTGLIWTTPATTRRFQRQGEADWVTLDDGEKQPNPTAIPAWLHDLAQLKISRPLVTGELADPSVLPEHVLVLEFANASPVTLAASPTGGGQAHLSLSSRPGEAFLLPDWRFDLYFRRFPDLYPETGEAFLPSQAVFLDFRRDGRNLKLFRASEGWKAVGTEVPVEQEKVANALAILSAWRPLDRLEPDTTTDYLAPTVEVSLASGVRQFLLLPEDSRFALPRVRLENGAVFTVATPVAAIMFPDPPSLLAPPPPADAGIGESAPENGTSPEATETVPEDRVDGDAPSLETPEETPEGS